MNSPLSIANDPIKDSLISPSRQQRESLRIIKTDRTLILPITELDRRDVTKMLQNESVMQYVTYGKRSPSQAAAEFSQWLEEWLKQPEYGIFGVYSQQDKGKFIGLLKLYLSSRSLYLQIGYGLTHEFWGQGLGTEIAEAGKKYAFDRLGVPFLDAFARVENVASQRILEKIGMDCIQDRFVDQGRVYAHYRVAAQVLVNQQVVAEAA